MLRRWLGGCSPWPSGTAQSRCIVENLGGATKRTPLVTITEP
jgi:hypothetical protein